VPRKQPIRLSELRQIRIRFVVILGSMAVVTVGILGYLGVRVFVSKSAIQYMDFFSLCFYGLASFVMTIAQVAFLHQLTRGTGREIEAMAHTDELTGLGNRRSAARFISEELHEAQLSHHPLSVLFIDLDGLKGINDQYGHQAGDQVIQAVARVLRRSVREVDMVARLGGDEFVVVLPETESSCSNVVARRITGALDAIRIPVGAEEQSTVEISGLTASIGISAYPANALTREALVRDADRSMYAAKNAGRGNIVISKTRAEGPEPKAAAEQITHFADQLDTIAERTRSVPLAEAQAPKRASHV
jgi:diguanylate cyclase (GGDEF)-like protein